MEGPSKKSISPTTVSPLNLHLFLPYPDARRLIWRHLNALDREMIRCAHNSQRRMEVSGPFLLLAMKEGHFQLAEMILNHVCKKNFYTYSAMRRYDCAEEIIGLSSLLAATNDRTHLEWLMECWMKPNVYSVFQEACGHGHVEFLTWFHDDCGYHLHEMSVYAFEAAAKGYLTVLEWLHARQYEIFDDVATTAARHGHRHIIEWIFQEELGFDRSIYDGAIQFGDPELLDWIAEKLLYTPTQPEYYEVAVEAKQLSSMIWLYSHGCPLAEYIWNMVNENEEAAAAYTANGIRPWLMAHYKNE